MPYVCWEGGSSCHSLAGSIFCHDITNWNTSLIETDRTASFMTVEYNYVGLAQAHLNYLVKQWSHNIFTYIISCLCYGCFILIVHLICCEHFIGYVVLQCFHVCCFCLHHNNATYIFFSDFTIGKHEKFLATSKQRHKSPRGKDVALSKHSNSLKVFSLVL